MHLQPSCSCLARYATWPSNAGPRPLRCALCRALSRGSPERGCTCTIELHVRERFGNQAAVVAAVAAAYMTQALSRWPSLRNTSALLLHKIPILVCPPPSCASIIYTPTQELVCNQSCDAKLVLPNTYCCRSLITCVSKRILRQLFVRKTHVVQNICYLHMLWTKTPLQQCKASGVLFQGRLVEAALNEPHQLL
jgi:hypothetical protein